LIALITETLDPPVLTESDRRASAVAVGLFAVTCLLLVALTFVLMDVERIWDDVRGVKKGQKRKTKPHKTDVRSVSSVELSYK